MTITMKELRNQYADSIAAARDLLKEQTAVRRELCKALRERPMAIPELAEATGMPTHKILWHITAMKKYDLVTETGRCGEYYLYAMAEEDEA